MQSTVSIKVMAMGKVYTGDFNMNINIIVMKLQFGHFAVQNILHMERLLKKANMQKERNSTLYL